MLPWQVRSTPAPHMPPVETDGGGIVVEADDIEAGDDDGEVA